jgi:hypothetical protein
MGHATIVYGFKIVLCARSSIAPLSLDIANYLRYRLGSTVTTPENHGLVTMTTLP